MSLPELLQKLDQRQVCIAVIGLGYVGITAACALAEAGFDTLGVEILPDRVAKINAGHLPMDGDEPGLADLLASVVQAGKLRATNDYRDLVNCDIILVDVETPVNEQHKPRYDALRAALRSLGPVIKQGALVIIESTIAPGTMRELVCPLLEESTGKRANVDFFLGNCPERVMPGKLLANLHSLSRVCGGGDEETAQAMMALYRCIVHADLDPVDWITAELVKTVENAYRDVQIAFANEVALICEAVGGNVWQVRELVNKSPFRLMHLPGAGVGGHCIPKDPWLLVYGVDGKEVPVRLIPTARAINDGMPEHVATLLEEALADVGKDLQESRILVLGYAYREDSDDTRNSPSEVLLQILREKGAETVTHDPFVLGCQGDIYEMAKGCDAAVLMVAHTSYQEIDFHKLGRRLKTPVFIDGRNSIPSLAGATSRSIGKSHASSLRISSQLAVKIHQE